MASGIILFGAMAVGDTTLGKEVAMILNFAHIDLDDYHWRWDTEIPYTVFRSRDERISSIMKAIGDNPHFVMSGSMWSIRKTFEHFFDMAVFLYVPTEVRAKRLKMRSEARWGNRVLPGGDMYESSDMYKDYLAFAKLYDEYIMPQMCSAQHEQWIKELQCPVLRLDGTKPISFNAQIIVEEYLKIKQANNNHNE